MIQHKCNSFSNYITVFGRRYFKIIYIPIYKFEPAFSPRNHELKKLEYTTPEDDSSQVLAFLTKWFLGRRFLKNFFMYISL